jgi:putative salt-induced outer membrane protein YdiY
MKLKFYIPLILGLLTSLGASAQNDVAIKTNVLYDLTATVNAGVEVGLAPRWTIDLSGNFNAWNLSEEKRWKHYLVQPEARYWFCDRFMGHFLGIHAHGGQYNVGGLKNNINFLGTDLSKLTDSRYQGWFAGAGIAYGYAFVLGRHWNLELELGVGYAYTKYDSFECAGCGRKVETGLTHHYVGPTKLALNLVYLF